MSVAMEKVHTELSGQDMKTMHRIRSWLKRFLILPLKSIVSRKQLKVKKIIIEPNSPSPGVVVAFIEDNGAPIEFIEVDSSIAEVGI